MYRKVYNHDEEKVNFYCCNHDRNKNMYHLGYVGLKCCKVAVCLDCEKVQSIGTKFGRFIYPIAKKITQNRIYVLKTIEIEPLEENGWVNPLES